MADKPNVVMIMGDDIGVTNLSCYSHGLMGYKTPNIDRLANEGIMFTDYYAEQSCTAGRAAFITGQSPFRTGLSKVGMPHQEGGMLEGTTTLAWALKDQGYRTAQFGKNHFGDAPETYPTNHGFDEFYGVFYHLGAYEATWDYNYPKDPEFKKKYGPRNLMHTYADGREVDKGEVTDERFKTIDDEFGEEAIRFMRESVSADEPFFLWHNMTHMHYYTQTKDSSLGQSGGSDQSPYHDTMIDHDKNVGEILDAIDELGITDNTIVIYTTDNGPHANQWPDAATTWFRSEKITNWDGAFRVPCVARYPKKWHKGEVLNDIVASYDWFTTIMSELGVSDVKEQYKKGPELAGQKLKPCHLDGYDQSAYFAGKSDKGERNEFVYMSSEADVLAVRYGNWKANFKIMETAGTEAVWLAPFTTLRAPLIFNLRTDPFEAATTNADVYWRWLDKQGEWLIVPVLDIMKKFAQTTEDFPPLQEAASWTIKQTHDHVAATANSHK